MDCPHRLPHVFARGSACIRPSFSHRLAANKCSNPTGDMFTLGQGNTLRTYVPSRYGYSPGLPGAYGPEHDEFSRGLFYS